MKEQLRKDLRRLHEELARSDSIGPEARERLAAIARDIESRLEAEEDSDEESLGDRLRSAAEHFEESHPNLTAAVGRVADALAALGI